jgi:hypothetical protein
VDVSSLPALMQETSSRMDAVVQQEQLASESSCERPSVHPDELQVPCHTRDGRAKTNFGGLRKYLNPFKKNRKKNLRFF